MFGALVIAPKAFGCQAGDGAAQLGFTPAMGFVDLLQRRRQHPGDARGGMTRLVEFRPADAALGFRQLRVRHYGELARLEVPVDEFDAVLASRGAVVAAVHAAGYRYVTLDLEGFRSGNLNSSL